MRSNLRKVFILSFILTIIFSLLGAIVTRSFNLLYLPMSFSVHFIFVLSWYCLYQSSPRRVTSLIGIGVILSPLISIAYYITYAGRLNDDLFGFIIREPDFFFEGLLMFLNPLSAILSVIAAVAIYLGFNKVFSFKESKTEYLVLFKKWPSLIFLLVAEVIQIRWCLKRDMSQILERVLLPLLIFFIFSALYGAYKSELKKRFKVLAIGIVIFGLSFHIGASRPLLKGIFTDLPLDSDFFRGSLVALFQSNKTKNLEQQESIKLISRNLPNSKLDYNILVIVNDALRLDAMGDAGYALNTDEPIEWFLNDTNTHRFDYPVAASNMTDTSVPTMFTGVGTNRDASQIKNSLRMWDYFEKEMNTFYISTAGTNYAYLDRFLKTEKLDKLWSVSDITKNKIKIINEGDEISGKKLLSHLSSIKGNYVGVWHTNASHSYMGYSDESKYKFPSRLEHFKSLNGKRVRYDNSIHYQMTQINKVLRSIDLQRTIVVLTSDHGEGFGEHGYHFHNQDYHQEAVRVPFYWHIPQSLWSDIPSDAKSCFNLNKKDVSSTMDLVPTLLSLHLKVRGVDLFKNPSPYTGVDLFKCHDDRVVFSSHCLSGYRCFKRNILFANKNFSLIFDPKKGIEGLYDTFGDIEQLNKIQYKDVKQRPEMKSLIEKSKKLHSFGIILEKSIN